MKTCTKCGVEKALDEFYFIKSKGRHETRCLACRAAYMAAYEVTYRKANKERISERRAAYYKANKGRISEQQAAYRKANKERISKRNAAYRRANKEQISEREAAYRKANKEQISKRDAAYYEANKDRISEQSAAYYKANKERICEQKAAYHGANRERLNEQSAAYYKANKEQISERMAVYYKTPRGKEVMRKASQRRRAKMQGGILAPGAVDHVPSNQCYWCGDIADEMHEDHVIPVARGGSNEPMNLVWACAPCNLRKHAKHPLRWIAEQFEEAV